METFDLSRYASLPYEIIARPSFDWEITKEEVALQKKIDKLVDILNPPRKPFFINGK